VNIRAIIGPVAGVLLLAPGCGHKNDYVPLNGAALRASTPRSIRAPVVAPAKFDGESLKRTWIYLAMFGALGGAMSYAAGAGGSVDGEGINDPAKLMRLELGSLLAETFEMDFVVATTPADLQLEVSTVEWGIVATRMRHYGVNYQARLRLWDLRTKKVVAQALCDSGPPRDQPSNPTTEELNSKAGLHLIKGRLGAAADHCLQEFRNHTLGLRR
jgi:hypothetical protein